MPKPMFSDHLKVRAILAEKYENKLNFIIKNDTKIFKNDEVYHIKLF